MEVGITGSKGFIGKHLVEALKDRKSVKLSFFDLPKYDLLDLNSVKRFIEGKDLIVHAAAVNRGSDSEIIAGSVVATHNLISAIKKSGKKTKLIFLSSIQAETDTAYGISKKLTEIMLQDFSREYKTPVTVFRFINIFGEGCRPFYNSVVATFCYQVANDKKPTISGSSKQLNLIHVKDVVNLILKEVSAKRKHPFYFKRVTSKNTISVKNLADLIKSFYGQKPFLKSKFHRNLYNTYVSFKNPRR